jgi:hypothetical protein
MTVDELVALTQAYIDQHPITAENVAENERRSRGGPPPKYVSNEVLLESYASARSRGLKPRACVKECLTRSLGRDPTLDEIYTVERQLRRLTKRTNFKK